MNVLNRSSSSALDLQYDNTMETRCSERGLYTVHRAISLFVKVLGLSRETIGHSLQARASKVFIGFAISLIWVWGRD